MSDYTLSADHSATMKTSHGITLNTSQSFVPYNINVVPASAFKISEEIKKVEYIGHAMDIFVSKGAELKDIENAGTIGTISAINGTTTITNVSGSIVIPSKSNLKGSIVFKGNNGTSDVTLKYDSAKGCMVFVYD